MTGRSDTEQHLRDLARLRRVRDRMDRAYAQPLDGEALARGVHMSAGHLGREIRRACGESPYAHLMTQRIERDGAAASRRPQRDRGLLGRRLRVAGHLQHALHRTGRCVAQRVPAGRGAGDGGTDEKRTSLELVAEGSCFGVDLATTDLDGTSAQVEAAGAEVVQEPIEQPYGVRDRAFRVPRAP